MPTYGQKALVRYPAVYVVCHICTSAQKKTPPTYWKALVNLRARLGHFDAFILRLVDNLLNYKTIILLKGIIKWHLTHTQRPWLA